jgi:hypothetical protein
MEKLAGFIVTVLILFIVLAFAFGSMADSAAKSTNAQANLTYARGQAEAMVIRAQAESRLQAAQAAAITSASLLPWGVLAILGLLGLAVVALCVVIVTRPPRQPAPYLIERQIVYLPAPGQSRREVWQALSDTARPDVLLIPGEVKRVEEVNR